MSPIESCSNFNLSSVLGLFLKIKNRMDQAQPAKYTELLNVENGKLQIDWDCMEDFIKNGPDIITNPSDYFGLFQDCNGDYDQVEERLMGLWNQIGLSNLEKKPLENDEPAVIREKNIFKSYILALNAIVFVGAMSALGASNTIVQNDLDQELIEMIKPKDMKIVEGTRSKNGTTTVIRIDKDTNYYQSSFWTGFFNTNTISTEDEVTDDLTTYVLEPGYQMFQFYQLLLTIPEGMARSDIVSTKIIWAPELNTRLHLHGQYSVLVNYRQVAPDKYIHISYTNISEMWNSFYHYYQLRVLEKPFGCNGKSSLRYTNNDVFKTLQYLRKGDSIAEIGNPTRKYKKKPSYNNGYSNGNKFQKKKSSRFSFK